MIQCNNIESEDIEKNMENLLENIVKNSQTYDFLDEWEEIRLYLEKYIVEINILGSLRLIPPEKVDGYFREILKSYPETIAVIPLFLCIGHEKTKENIVMIDINNITVEILNFYKYGEFDIERILEFCKKTRIINLFVEINDLYSYLIGLHVGLKVCKRNYSIHIFLNKLISIFK
ncbi:MAG: DpnII family type II restriction endonuclease [Methanobacteriaceae archaeon]